MKLGRRKACPYGEILMKKDLHTNQFWRNMLDHTDTATCVELFLIKAVMAATPMELKELERFLPALVRAERARREDECYPNGNGTAYRPE